MRLGTRWDAGTPAPTALPADVAARVAEVERALGADAAGRRWTLTWLEGSPVVELDDGTRVTVVAGEARTGHADDEPDDDDSWLDPR